MIMEYVKRIVIIVIMFTICINLAADKSYVKYIKLVMGLILIITVIKPLINNDGLFDKIYNKAKREIDISELNAELRYSDINSYESIIKPYIEDIKSNVNNIVVNNNYRLNSCEVELCLDKDNSSFGSIDNIDITIKRLYEDNDSTIETKKNDNKIKEIIKSSISDFYKLDIKNINVNIAGGKIEN